MTNRLGWDLGANHPQGNPNVGLEGMNNMSDILVKNGGYGQQERMIFDKRRTFDRVLRSSYQAATIRRVQSLDPIESSSNSRVYDKGSISWYYVYADRYLNLGVKYRPIRQQNDI